MRQRLVFADPVAFRYLGEDSLNIERWGRWKLTGYEIYLVEQWACSRAHPSFLITTYTGLPQHMVDIGILELPASETDWPPRLCLYLKAMSKLYGRWKETQFGHLMVTNLSNLPSALNIIPIPELEINTYRESFILNENLKRLGCSGRAGLNLSGPTGGTRAKFYELFRTSPANPFKDSVLELVRTCQVALILFAELAPPFADSLLCDVTEKAIKDWWAAFGLEYFDSEPSDGILGPTTVSALLGTLLGARNRLQAYGAPISKDVFDVRSTKKAIGYFQKLQKLKRSRRLDRPTLDRLRRITSKAATNDGWAVPKAVKSTVAELGGKRGEMVIGMVGGRGKAGIADVETADLAEFITKISGEHCKWLWQGKPKKNHSVDISTLADAEDPAPIQDAVGSRSFPFIPNDMTREQHNLRFGETHLEHLYSNLSDSQSSLEPPEKDKVFRKTVMKSVAGHVSDAKTGLGRIKEAVGIPTLKAHSLRTKESQSSREAPESKATLNDHAVAIFNRLPSGSNVNTTSWEKQTICEEFMNKNRSRAASKMLHGQLHEASQLNRTGPLKLSKDILNPHEYGKALNVNSFGATKAVLDKGNTYPAPSIFVQQRYPALQKTRSLQEGRNNHDESEKLVISSRRVSLGTIERNFSRLDSTFDIVSILETEHMDLGEYNKGLALEPARRKAGRMDGLTENSLPGLSLKIEGVRKLETKITLDRESLDLCGSEKLKEQEVLRQATLDLMAEEKMSLFESLKEVEVLGAKLEYELSSLIPKVEDVEEGVAEFEQQLAYLEERSSTLIRNEH